MRKLKPYPEEVCNECGIKASKAAGNDPPCFSVSTYHSGICEVCGEAKAVTEPRDFYYPEFYKP